MAEEKKVEIVQPRAGETTDTIGAGDNPKSTAGEKTVAEPEQKLDSRVVDEMGEMIPRSRFNETNEERKALKGQVADLQKQLQDLQQDVKPDTSEIDKLMQFTDGYGQQVTRTEFEGLQKDVTRERGHRILTDFQSAHPEVTKQELNAIVGLVHIGSVTSLEEGFKRIQSIKGVSSEAGEQPPQEKITITERGGVSESAATPATITNVKDLKKALVADLLAQKK